MRPVILAFVFALAASASAQETVEPWGSRNFSARRIAVPEAGQALSIVQIDPTEEPYHLTPAYSFGSEAWAQPATVPSDLSYGWFWSGVSPELSAGNPDRLAAAVAQLQLAKIGLQPLWAVMAALVEELGSLARAGAAGTTVSPALLMAVIAVESGGRPDAVSTAGAQGLMQLMPATAQRFGVSDVLNPKENIRGGAQYLGFLLRIFGGDPVLALAAYNAGEGAVARNKGVPPFDETRGYVPKVLAAWQVARMFCQVPPRAVTDPCAFSAQPKRDQGG